MLSRKGPVTFLARPMRMLYDEFAPAQHDPWVTSR